MSFSCPDGIFSVSRGVLASCGTTLSFAGASFGDAKIATIRLHDDHENASALASVVRFLSGVHVDLCPSRAPIVAKAALRWRVPTLFIACFAVAEPIPLSQSSLTAWLPTLRHWLPVLDFHGDGNGLLLSLPFRFRSLFIRRAAILLPNLISMTSGCAQCGLPQQANPRYSKRRTSSPKKEKTSPSCIFCARLHSGRSFWHALCGAGLLAEVIREAVRMTDPIVTEHIYRTLILILSEELRGVDETVCMLGSSDWYGAWAVAAKYFIAEDAAFRDIRVSAILTHTFLNARSQERGGASYIGCVCNQVQKLSFNTEQVKDTDALCENWATWDDWTVGMRCTVDVIQNGSNGCGKIENCEKESQDSTNNSILLANIRAVQVRDKDTDMQTSTIGVVDCNRPVVVKIRTFVGGCACELGCAKEERCRNGTCEVGLGDKRMNVKTDWSTVQGNGVDVVVFDVGELRRWCICHQDHCSVYVSAAVSLVGVGHTAESVLEIGNEFEGWECGSESSTGSQKSSEDSVPGSVSSEDYDGGADEQIVCACRKCQSAASNPLVRS